MRSNIRHRRFTITVVIVLIYIAFVGAVLVYIHDVKIVFGAESVIDVSLLLPLIGVLIVYFLDKWRTESERKQSEEDKRKRAYESLRKELEDARSAISGAKWKIQYGKDVAEYTSKYLNHDVYDSLLVTGDIFYINYNMQQKIQDIAKTIKFHNQCLEKAERIVIENSSDDKLPDDKYRLVFRYHRLMQKCEESLLRDIETVVGE